MTEQKRNWFQRTFQTRSAPLMSIGDPAFAGYVRMSTASLSEMSELIALRQPAMWRAINLIAGTIASLPLKSYRNTPDGEREQVKSFLDNPGALGLTRMAFVEMVMVQLLLTGEVGLMHIFDGAGRIVQLLPVNPLNYQVFWNGHEKEFKVTLGDGTQKTYIAGQDFTQIMGITLDGMRGISPLNIFRRSIQLGQSMELAANRTMVNGMLVGGLVTPEEDLTEDEAKAIQQGLDEKILGAENAGGLHIVNRHLKFSPWATTMVDAQFIQGRSFQIAEVARMFGVPLHMLAEHTKDTSWGTGLAEGTAGFQKFTLMGWTTRIEEALSNLLPQPRFCEFDYSGLFQGTPAVEINLLLTQMEGGLITPNEARALRNLDPLPGGDVLRTAAPAPVLDTKMPDQGGNKVFSKPPAKTPTKRITRIKKSSNGELVTTTTEE